MNISSGNDRSASDRAGLKNAAKLIGAILAGLASIQPALTGLAWFWGVAAPVLSAMPLHIQWLARVVVFGSVGYGAIWVVWRFGRRRIGAVVRSSEFRRVVPVAATV